MTTATLNLQGLAALLEELQAYPYAPDFGGYANCHNYIDPDAYFLTPRSKADRKRVDDALDLCEDCPVRAQCAIYGTTERHGRWGGRVDETQPCPAGHEGAWRVRDAVTVCGLCKPLEDEAKATRDMDAMVDAQRALELSFFEASGLWDSLYELRNAGCAKGHTGRWYYSVYEVVCRECAVCHGRGVYA